MEPEVGSYSDEALAARGDTDSFILLYRKSGSRKTQQ